MKETQYITPSGVKVIIRDPQSSNFQPRLENAVAEFMKKQGGKRNAQ